MKNQQEQHYSGVAPARRPEQNPPLLPLVIRQWRDGATSPERRKVWSEPKPKRVCVVYYLCRNGQLEHPHFMELALSDPKGLFLRDVISRLDFLRGKGLASAYSWSVKRSYKNGFVWHDLSPDDLIVPTHGHDYVLKGSERHSLISGEVGSPEPAPAPEFTHRRRHKSSPWSSFDLTEYKVYKSLLPATTALAAADAATQTDEARRPPPEPSTELESEEISPPPSSSSPDTQENTIKASNGAVGNVGIFDSDRGIGSGRMRASAVLMQLISCGSVNVKDPSGGSSPVSGNLFSGRLSSGRGAFDGSVSMDSSGFSGLVRVEEKEYFSGSLIETKKKKSGVVGVGGEEDGEGFSGLKRSSSYNADRISKLDLVDKETDNVGAKCIPRKSKTLSRKESAISRSSLGSLGSSKRINEEVNHIM